MKNLNRRDAIKISAAGVAGICAVSTSKLYAQDMKIAKPGVAGAKALEYVEESKKDDQNCANCQFYLEPTEKTKDGKKYAKCPMLANNYVVDKGWCKVWKARA